MKGRMVAVVAAVLLATSGSTHALAAERPKDSDFQVAVNSFADKHPGDLTGLQQLVHSLGGEFQVSSTVSSSSSARAVEADIKDFVADDGRNSNAAKDSEAGEFGVTGNFRSDVFAVTIWSASNASGTSAVVSGQTNWRDNFAGQAAPFDIGSIQFNRTCGTLSGHNVVTRTYAGKRTYGSTLRDAGVSNGAPVWNIDSRSVGFVNTADTARVSVTYNRSGCGSSTIQASYTYEGNQGGSLVGVSAGWGGLSVSYSNPGLTLQKSTGALTLKFVRRCTTPTCAV